MGVISRLRILFTLDCRANMFMFLVLLGACFLLIGCRNLILHILVDRCALLLNSAFRLTNYFINTLAVFTELLYLLEIVLICLQ